MTILCFRIVWGCIAQGAKGDLIVFDRKEMAFEEGNMDAKAYCEHNFACFPSMTFGAQLRMVKRRRHSAYLLPTKQCSDPPPSSLEIRIGQLVPQI